MAECSSSNDELITATFHGLKYSHYFEVVEEESKNTVLYALITKPYLVHEIQLEISKHILPQFTKTWFEFFSCKRSATSEWKGEKEVSQ